MPINPTSFTQKLIEIDVTLDPNPQTNAAPFFTSAVSGQSNANKVTLAGLRTSVRVQYAGQPKGSTAKVLVYGLTPSLMDQMSTLGLVFNIVPHNTITVRAGDLASGLSTVFTGTIWSATADFNRAPDVPFTFECIAGLFDQVVPTDAVTFSTPFNVVNAMQQFAQQAGYGFENDGVPVTSMLPPSYYPGTVTDQWKKLKDDAQIEADLFPGVATNQVLAIWPTGGSRTTLGKPLISPTTGMIGYPAYSQVGLSVKTIYNPGVALGGQIQIQSSLPKATGTWVVLKVDHALDSMLPEGLWESTLLCFNQNYAAKNGVPKV